jgi:hypothetical protein
MAGRLACALESVLDCERDEDKWYVDPAAEEEATTALDARIALINELDGDG